MRSPFRRPVKHNDMVLESSSGDDGDTTCGRYRPCEDRLLSTAVLQTIGDHKDEDMTRSEFLLYDAIDPDALDHLFRADARPEPTVEFAVDSVSITLRGAEDGDGVAIRVTDQPE